MWSATWASVALGARSRHARTESRMAIESRPAARSRAMPWEIVSPYARSASDT